MLSLLIPAFSLLLRPHVLSVMLHPYRMLLYHCNVPNNIYSKLYTLLDTLQSANSVYSLAPVIFRATSLDQ